MADRLSAEPAVQAGTLLWGSKTLGRTLAAFTYRNFRIQWFGACTSSIGTWMQIVAQNWLVYSLTKSTAYLGLDAFLQQLPIMLFTLIGGVLADRLDRRRTLLASQYLQMATSATLALLMYFGVVQIWHILTLSTMTGLAQAFGGPAYQSLVPSLVDKKDLPNAVALNSIQFNVARVLGPLLFSAILALFLNWGYDEPHAMNACFALNAMSFLVVIATLLSLRLTHIPPAKPGSMKDELAGGLAYVRDHGTLVGLIVLAAATTFLGFSVLTFLPVLAQQVFHEGASTYSHLMAFSGAGSILGALVVAWLGRFKGMGLTALLVQAVYGALIVAFATSRVLWLSELLLFCTGLALMMMFSTVTSLVQLSAPEHMRGRVMSIYMLAFRGGMPLGSLVSGFLATSLGAPTVIGMNGVLLVVVAAYFLLRSHGVREILVVPVLEVLASSGFGLLLGMRHALEPDHLAAVSTLVSHERGGLKAAWLGLWWGAGHTLALLAVGVSLVVLRAELPRSLATLFEFGVAVMLVMLGGRAIARAIRLGHRAPVAPGATAWWQVHRHAGLPPHVHVGRWTLAGRPLLIGAMHGLAGSGALTALVLATLPSTAARLSYMALFGLGSAVGMATLSGLLGWPLARLGSSHAIARSVTLVVGCTSAALGMFWGWKLL